MTDDEYINALRAAWNDGHETQEWDDEERTYRQVPDDERESEFADFLTREHPILARILDQNRRKAKAEALRAKAEDLREQANALVSEAAKIEEA